ncbi:Alpha-hemolysin translocation ATP-binding protein HlyB [Enhygromyxa salina]|uniref:Alpha-hemolysin translocation ATP-binding protein HlyB n=1 Tax=Enhygromyxa salina TaxID=215803 RepID=A0A2S9XJT5_9BACT|nr:ABC transporter ATP-binding protein [Enhygromyxa salina]PRP92951.1 Alpha-hemolysin translocation ATP-binding protein HlyB [Enhygromyxa salina]
MLELVAHAAGVSLEPRAAWEAAAEGLAGGRGDLLRSLGLAGRGAGLRLGSVAPEALVTGGAPSLTWIPGGRSGRFVVVLGRRGRKLELVVIDESGERRRRMSRGKLDAWLELEFGATELEAPRWLRAEPLLPLASLEARAVVGPEGRLGPLRRLLALARLERADLGVVFVYAVAIGGMSLAVPVAVQALVNTVAFGSVLQPLVVLSLLLALCLGFVAVLRVLQALVVEALQRRLFVDTAADFARRFPRLASEVRREYHAPELANRFFDVLTLQKAGATLLLDGLALALQMAVGMVLLAFYHPILLAFDLALLIAVALVVVVAGRGAVASSLEESKHKYAVAAWLEDLAASPLRFADAGARAFADARAELLIREWLRARGDHFTRLLRQLGGGVGLQAIASTALLGIGGWLVIRRQLTLGQLVAAELVVTAIGAGLGKLGKQLESFYDATASVAKIGKIVDMPLERGGGELLAGAGPLELVARDRQAGTELLALAPGDKLVLVGRSPARSELCDALFGLGDPAQLDLRVDGCALAGLDLEALRADVALVRGVELVAGSILDNLDPRLVPRDKAAIREVLELVGLRERVDALPEGLRSSLLPSGWPLREAEARRLMLAQALLRRPRLLILDGALDGLGLNAEAHARLLDHLFAADAPWTLVVITVSGDLGAERSEVVGPKARVLETTKTVSGDLGAERSEVVGPKARVLETTRTVSGDLGAERSEVVGPKARVLETTKTVSGDLGAERSEVVGPKARVLETTKTVSGDLGAERSEVVGPKARVLETTKTVSGDPQLRGRGDLDPRPS